MNTQLGAAALGGRTARQVLSALRLSPWHWPLGKVGSKWCGQGQCSHVCHLEFCKSRSPAKGFPGIQRAWLVVQGACLDACDLLYTT